jgi:hypothetical protein
MGIPPALSRALGAVVFFFVIFHPSSAAAQHFTDCLTSANNTTVFVADSVAVTIGDGSALANGDEIAVFTEDGDCAGVVTWDGNNTVISAAGKSPFEPDSARGFEAEEPLQFQVWDASEQVVYIAGSEDVAFVPCTEISPCSHDDGRYRTDALMHLAVIDAASPLPVELTSFTARPNGQRAVLEWSTASETNNAGFEVQVQRLRDGPPSWEALGFVEGYGTTTEPRRYRYDTDALATGRYRFRLKQIDYDGAFEYSPTVEVTLTLDEAYELSAPYPNPAVRRAEITLAVARAQDVQVTIYNALGQRLAVVHDGPLTPTTTHTLPIDGRALPSGLYFVQVRGETFQATRRITFVK